MQELITYLLQPLLYPLMKYPRSIQLSLIKFSNKNNRIFISILNDVISADKFSSA